MNISLNWLRDYLTLELPVDEIADILTAIGLEVSGVKEIESVKGGLIGIIAGEVKTCEKHPNADKLSTCTVDVGADELLPIVCGAPNVAAGQKVWVAEVGATLHPYGSEESFQIKKAKIRGEESRGMICAEDEIGLGADHDGIVVLPNDVATGTSARGYYGVTTDYVIDIDLTPNRSDAISHLGVAEDLAAYLIVNKLSEGPVNWPSKDVAFPTDLGSPITVEVQDHEACPRYAGVLIEGIEVKESPRWLKQRLQAIGVRPISNMVDITNFVLHEMGQPLHAFDADKIGGNGIVVKCLDEGTPFVTLDNVERKLGQQDLMICDREGHGHCIAGVFGGLGSGVTESTTRIFLEAAHFNAISVRRTSTRHLLRTDAAKSFEKGTDPNICVTALKRAASLMMELAGGRVASDIIDIYPVAIEKTRVYVRWQRIHLLIGVEIPVDRIKAILSALSIEILEEDAKGITVAIPTNKSDVTREADVIEEILRIHGFNNIPLAPRMEMALTAVEQPTRYKFRNMIGSMLTAQGFCEAMGMSLTETSYIEEGPLAVPVDERVVINNTSNIGLNVMRPGLLVTALEMVRYNLNRNQDSLKLYEFGRGYSFANGETQEVEQLSLIMTGNERPQNWLEVNGSMADFYSIKAYVTSILRKVGATNYRVEEDETDTFSGGLKVVHDGNTLVRYGMISNALAKSFDIAKPVLYAEFNVDGLYRSLKKAQVVVSEISKYPGSKRDLAFILSNAVNFSELERCVRDGGGKLLKSVELFDVYRNDEHLGEGKKSYAIQLFFEDLNKTLTDKIVDKQVRRIVQKVQSDIGGLLRE